jgi:hypothetical protein
MLQACVDGSGTGDPRLFVLAGGIATVEQWAAFSTEWQERLNMRPPLEYFKQSEMVQSPERLERSGWFERVLRDHVTALISCVVRTEELVKVVREIKWPVKVVNADKLGNPYYFAFHAIMNKLAQYQEQLGISEPVYFVFDDEGEKKNTLQGWDRIKLSVTPEVRKLMGSTPTYRDDKQFLPLQGADLFAYWVRQMELNKIKGVPEGSLYPWRASVPKDRKEGERFWLHMEFREQDFRIETAKWTTPEVIARAQMNDEEVAAALRDLEQRERGIKMTLPDPSSG